MKLTKTLILIVIITALASTAYSDETPAGTAWVSAYGYDGCIELTNGIVRVVLEPNCGGRVIEYSITGKNALFVDTSQNGRTYTPGKPTGMISGGRFDIGPEKTGPKRQELWAGKWTAEITGPRSARMTSVDGKESGVRLVRDFSIDTHSSRLRFSQTIINISDETKQYFFWSRTFGTGGGICVVPISEGSRFPSGYIYYEPKRSPKYMNFRPEEHPGTRVRDGFLEIAQTPPFPKFGLDSAAGWIGYVSKNDLLFVKQFEVYPERVYGEMAGLTVSIWYVEDRCEIEPIGPRETLKPGESASYEVDWYLFPYDYPDGGAELDLKALETFVKDSVE